MERKTNKTLTLFWFRRDLRIEDNAGLFHALSENEQVQPLFIFDINILDEIDVPTDKRLSFIFEYVQKLKNAFNKHGGDLWVFYGKPFFVFKQLLQEYHVKNIYTNNDYEPYARERDSDLKDLCQAENIPFYSFKDQVIFEKDEISKQDGKPYTVFTPYMRKWKATFTDNHLQTYHVQGFLNQLNPIEKPSKLINLDEMGFTKTDHLQPPPKIPINLIENYHQTRDRLDEEGTSRLSVHLRFGTISIRKLIKTALQKNETYLNELIWREFYMQILWHFPQVVTRSFKPAYDNISWNESEEDFERWCHAQTGYPIVDAAMNQLVKTGFMHNRARMIVASFLTKHLLIDWRKGEAFFAKHLTDYELSSNNGGWQWAASSGCDAVPYFRIFNPYTQAKKFDPNNGYINKWNGHNAYSPIIEHKVARERALSAFKKGLK